VLRRVVIRTIVGAVGPRRERISSYFFEHRKFQTQSRRLHKRSLRSRERAQCWTIGALHAMPYGELHHCLCLRRLPVPDGKPAWCCSGGSRSPSNMSRAQGPRNHAARGLAGGPRLPPGRTHPAQAPHGTYPMGFQAKFCSLRCREKPGLQSRDRLRGDSVCAAASAQRSSSPIYSYRDDTTCCRTSSPMVASFVPC